MDEKIYDFVYRYEGHEFIWDQDNARQHLRKEINILLQDDYETVYISWT